MTDMDKMMIEKVASAIIAAMGTQAGVLFSGYLARIAARAAITAYNPDDRLREALEALAGIKADDGDDFSTYPPEAIIRCEITAGEIHKARAVLAALSPLPQGDG